MAGAFRKGCGIKLDDTQTNDTASQQAYFGTHINNLKKNGFTNLIITTHYLEHKIIDILVMERNLE